MTFSDYLPPDLKACSSGPAKLHSTPIFIREAVHILLDDRVRRATNFEAFQATNVMTMGITLITDSMFVPMRHRLSDVTESLSWGI